MVLSLLLAQTGAIIDPSDPAFDRATFMKEYGPDKVTRIARMRDDDGNLVLIFDNVGGVKKDGSAEFTHLAMTGPASMFVVGQRATEGLTFVSDVENGALMDFFTTIYFAGDMKDVILQAKSDQELDVDILLCDKGDGMWSANDVLIVDFVTMGNWAYVYDGMKLAKIDKSSLTAKLDEGMGRLIESVPEQIAIGRGWKIGRGPLLQNGVPPIATVMATQVTDRGIMMKLFDADTLEAVGTPTILDSDATFVTADHDGMLLHFLGTTTMGPNVDDQVLIDKVPSTEVFADVQAK